MISNVKQIYDNLPPDIAIAIPVLSSLIFILVVVFVLSRTTNLFRGETNIEKYSPKKDRA